MNASIDAGIVKSKVWLEVKDKVYERLSKGGFTLTDETLAVS